MEGWESIAWRPARERLDWGGVRYREGGSGWRRNPVKEE
jgi:hypothetical protein